MTDVTYEIGAFDEDTKQVTVTFTDGDVVHVRTVNACLDGKGAYEADATASRIAEVAAGVAVKISLGVIKNEPEPVEPPATEPAPTA